MNLKKFTVLLFYKYIKIENPEQECINQRKICEENGLKGRVLLAKEGVNGTLSGTKEACEAYKKYMFNSLYFHDIEFKESESSFICFAKLHIKLRNEIVNFGCRAAEAWACPIAENITPEELHALLQNKPENVVLLDARNEYEAYIGMFEDAIVPTVKYFRDFPEYLENNKDLFQDKDVIMYCTGGIRCEISSAFLYSLNCARSIKKLEGGIHKYVEKFPNGFFKGRNYVFDDRVSMKINDEILATCVYCKKPCDLYNSCLNALCNKQYICCDDCLFSTGECCSTECRKLILDEKVPCRPQLVARKKCSFAESM